MSIRLRNAIIQIFESSRRKLDFSNLGYLPRWLVLLFDIFTCVLAIYITKFVVSSISLLEIESLYLLPSEGIILGVNVFFFLLFRTYAGLLRHSTFIDALKLFIASSFTFGVLSITHLIYIYITSIKLFSLGKLFIYFTVSYSLLFLIRVFVKQIFQASYNILDGGKITKTLIYGSDSNAIAIAKALQYEIPQRFKIVGFITNNSKQKSKQIFGLPIIPKNRKISTLLRSRGAEALILSDNKLNQKHRLKIVDDCLEYNYKVFRAPLVSDIENEKTLIKQIQNIQIEDLLERDPIVLDNKLIAKDLYQKIIFITGAAGSIGSEIVRQISNYSPKKIILIDQAETPLYQIQSEILKNYPQIDYEFIISDVVNYEKLERLFNIYRPNIVYHAAAYKHVPLMECNPSEAILVNVLGSKNLVDISLKYDVDKFVMVSTDKAVNPSNVMGASKRIAEMYVQSLHFHTRQSPNFKTNFITTRFGNVLGSNGSVVPLFKKQIEEGGPLTITHPEIIRYFMTIPEACQLVLEAASMGKGGEIFIFNMGKAVKIVDLATKIIKLAGFVPYKDIDIEIIGLRPGEKLYEELLNDKTKTLPTYNQKIMIAQLDAEDYNRLNEEISILVDYAKQFNTHKMVTQMKVIVPEYRSLNSQYELLDDKNQKN
ncbi:MAG: polysaccharide biosynthesis protein [Flavobacteriaceae bacterium]|nr:polysaccharide biosynthesis protein [Bacteroidia bacterium]NNK82454.1 polysaccharide biosynthesis protein [Flavobacteriaceae bacterium]